MKTSVELYACLRICMKNEFILCTEHKIRRQQVMNGNNKTRTEGTVSRIIKTDRLIEKQTWATTLCFRLVTPAIRFRTLRPQSCHRASLSIPSSILYSTPNCRAFILVSYFPWEFTLYGLWLWLPSMVWN